MVYSFAMTSLKTLWPIFSALHWLFCLFLFISWYEKMAYLHIHWYNPWLLYHQSTNFKSGLNIKKNDWSSTKHCVHCNNIWDSYILTQVLTQELVLSVDSRTVNTWQGLSQFYSRLCFYDPAFYLTTVQDTLGPPNFCTSLLSQINPSMYDAVL